MMNPNVGLGTKAIHAGNVKDAQYGALTTPIYQTSTFVFDSCEQGGRRFAGAEAGYIYTRLGNPTVSVLENKVAALEGGEACVAAASGMGAISSALWTIAGAGKHIVADGTLYGCTFALLNHGMTRYGVEVSFVDTSDLDEVRKALKPNTCAVYLETPANPNLKIADIAAVAALAFWLTRVHERLQGDRPAEANRTVHGLALALTLLLAAAYVPELLTALGV